VKEQVIEAVKMLKISQAFGEISSKQRPELRLVRRIDQLQLAETVKHLRGGDTKTCRPAAGNKL
jgi:hypothetical protein